MAPWFDDVGREVLADEVVAGPGAGPGDAARARRRMPEARAWIEKA